MVGEKEVESMYKQKVNKSFAEYVKSQMDLLKDYDHELFEEVCQGLVLNGWKELGGSNIFRLLSKKDGCSIKVFRNADMPFVILVNFTAGEAAYASGLLRKGMEDD